MFLHRPKRFQQTSSDFESNTDNDSDDEEALRSKAKSNSSGKRPQKLFDKLPSQEDSELAPKLLVPSPMPKLRDVRSVLMSHLHQKTLNLAAWLFVLRPMPQLRNVRSRVYARR